MTSTIIVGLKGNDMNNGDKSAAPMTASPGYVDEHGYHVASRPSAAGFTKREELAKAARVGLLASGAAKAYIDGLSEDQIKEMDWCVESHISLMAVSQANSLLAALESIHE